MIGNTNYNKTLPALSLVRIILAFVNGVKKPLLIRSSSLKLSNRGYKNE